MKTSTYPLRWPLSLKATVERASKEYGASVNQFVVTAAVEKLAALKTADNFAERRDPKDSEAARRVLRRAGGQSPAADDVL